MWNLVRGAWAGLGERGRIILLIVVAIVLVALAAMGYNIADLF